MADRKKHHFQHLVAGAFAGTSEHLITFPFDTLKTRIQFLALRKSSSFNTQTFQLFLRVLKQEGVFRLYRGLAAILVGAVPSHSLYFATYEASKHFFKIADRPEDSPHFVFVSGALATFAHDSIVTPLDVIKQRMQLPSTREGFFGTLKTLVEKEGATALFRSIPTTLAISLPYQGFYFITYENVKAALSKIFLTKNNSEKRWREYSIWLASGFAAGSTAGFLSNPLDVVKTYIQTTPKNRSVNTFSIFCKLVKTRGPRTLFSGATARILTCAPASAICWTSYEGMKRFLGWDLEEHI